MVFNLKYRADNFVKKGNSVYILYHLLRNQSAKQETSEPVEFIHSKVEPGMKTVKANPDIRTNVFL
jgi:hypothetical protein